MSSKELRRRNVRIANSRWTTYAVAAAATSLAGLATSEAEIHYSGLVNAKFKGLLLQKFPLENGASLDFFHNDLASGSGVAHFRIDGADRALFAGDASQTMSVPFYLYRLGSHVNVSQQPFGQSCFRSPPPTAAIPPPIVWARLSGGSGTATSPGRGEDSSALSSTPARDAVRLGAGENYRRRQI